MDQLPGGIGDKRSPAEFDPKALEKGINVELEHTKDKLLAREIAIDHLTEDPLYYDKLAKMEAVKTWKKGSEREFTTGDDFILTLSDLADELYESGQPEMALRLTDVLLTCLEG